ncbi:MAG: hypothetical protein ACTSXH_01225 [Promethearchaeota archaeon]
MSYEPFQVRIFPIFVYYMILSIFGVFMSFQMYLKYKKRKVKAPLYLMLVFIFLTSSIIILTVGLAEAAITGYFMEIYMMSLPLAYSMVIIADLMLFVFANHMMDKGNKLLPFLMIMGILIIISLFLPWNWWGVPAEEHAGELNIRFYTTGSLVIYSCAIYIYIALICHQVGSRTESKITKMGLQLMKYSMGCLILLFACITGDNLLIVFFDHPGYSFFLYIGWAFAVAFIILIYFSLIMPKWLLKRIEDK